MINPVQEHYQTYPYPRYPLLASVQRSHTYALNLEALWCRFNRALPPPEARGILLAGSGTFAPYPFAVANPDDTVTALDLSERSLGRARWHCLFHGRRNVVYRCGDLTDPAAVDGSFGLIDSFGVLHHLEDPLAGLKALEKRLVPGGILRIMVYSRYARREEEAIRRAFKLLGVATPRAARRLMGRALPGSRLARYLAAADEPESLAGLADALLHPVVHTFRIDELMEMVAQTGLTPLMFAHHTAEEQVQDEVARLRLLEKERYSPGNFVLYLGKGRVEGVPEGEPQLLLNPCLVSAVGRFTLGATQIPPRLGCENTLLTGREKSFLRRFVTPVLRSELSEQELHRVSPYRRQLFLLEYC